MNVKWINRSQSIKKCIQAALPNSESDGWTENLSRLQEVGGQIQSGMTNLLSGCSPPFSCTI